MLGVLLRFECVLVDAEAYAACLEKRRFDVVGVALFYEVSEDGVDFDGSTFLQVAIQGRSKL